MIVLSLRSTWDGCAIATYIAPSSNSQHPLVSDSDDEAPGGSSKPLTKKHLLPSMPVLCDWYREKASASSLTVGRPPVVMVIEDFEGFVPQVLQDLIISLR